MKKRYKFNLNVSKANLKRTISRQNCPIAFPLIFKLQKNFPFNWKTSPLVQLPQNFDHKIPPPKYFYFTKKSNCRSRIKATFLLKAIF